jgi:hypothetical protein
LRECGRVRVCVEVLGVHSTDRVREKENRERKRSEARVSTASDRESERERERETGFRAKYGERIGFSQSGWC